MGERGGEGRGMAWNEWAPQPNEIVWGLGIFPLQSLCHIYISSLQSVEVILYYF